MRTGKPPRLGDVLPGVLAGLGAGEALRSVAAVAAWERVVGERLGRFARAAGLRDGVLLVEAESSVWMQEIGYQKVRILKRLAEECGPGMVRDLKLVLRPAP
jgi:predicted nucleic acid-binding Zn ribbon protein